MTLPERSHAGPRPAPPIVREALRAPGVPLDVTTRTVMSARFGHDFSQVRVHTDDGAARSAEAVAARAYTLGSDVVFGAGQYRPRAGEGQRLLAHELTHVVQQRHAGSPVGEPALGERGDPAEREAHRATRDVGHSAPVVRRFEAPEHQDLGDSGFVSLAQFLGRPEGREWLDQHRLDPTLAADLPRDMNRSIRVGKLVLSPGDIIALMGDFYGTPDELANAPQGELEELLGAIRDERAGRLAHGEANERYENITRKWRTGKGGKTFLELAGDNAPHFTPTNREAWRRLHEQAIQMARDAGTDQAAFNRALLFDAAGGHFLTDAFASGHMFELKKLIRPGRERTNVLGGDLPLESAIKQYLATNPPVPPNPELASYYELAARTAGLDKLVLKNIHDRLNTEGVIVRNKKGMEWRAFGDDNLKKSPDALRIGALAVAVSRRQLSTVRANPAAAVDPQEVLDLLPDEQSVERITAQAIRYIPDAVRDIPSLLYRQEPALRAGLRTKIGLDTVIPGIIGANVRTIAAPDRARQIDDLLRQRPSGDRGPVVAPQFTVLEWR